MNSDMLQGFNPVYWPDPPPPFERALFPGAVLDWGEFRSDLAEAQGMRGPVALDHWRLLWAAAWLCPQPDREAALRHLLSSPLGGEDGSALAHMLHAYHLLIQAGSRHTGPWAARAVAKYFVFRPGLGPEGSEQP